MNSNFKPFAAKIKHDERRNLEFLANLSHLIRGERHFHFLREEKRRGFQNMYGSNSSLMDFAFREFDEICEGRVLSDPHPRFLSWSSSHAIQSTPSSSQTCSSFRFSSTLRRGIKASRQEFDAQVGWFVCTLCKYIILAHLTSQIRRPCCCCCLFLSSFLFQK